MNLLWLATAQIGLVFTPAAKKVLESPQSIVVSRIECAKAGECKVLRRGKKTLGAADAKWLAEAVQDLASFAKVQKSVCTHDEDYAFELAGSGGKVELHHGLPCSQLHLGEGWEYADPIMSHLKKLIKASGVNPP